MIKPLAYFHDLDTEHRLAVMISDIEEKELEKLYPNPNWCTMKDIFDRRNGCMVLMGGFVYDDNSLCKTCVHYKKEE